MRVLVTGSQGFTGKHLLPFLDKQGVSVYGLARTNSLLPNEVCADLLDKESVSAALAKVRPNVIIHLAGVALPGFADIEQMYRVNLFGTRNLLEAIIELNLPIDKFIASSSAHVYGVVDDKPVSETRCPRPLSNYGNSKLAMENICRLYMDKLPILLTRPFNYSGIGQSDDYVLAKMVNHFRRRELNITLGNIDVVRDFSWINDVVAYYWGLVNCKEHTSVVNLCSGRGVSLRQILELMNQIAGYEIEVKTNPSFLRQQDNPVFIGDNSYLQKLLPQISSHNLETWLHAMLSN